MQMQLTHVELQYLQIRRQYESALDENRKFKLDESKLLSSLQRQEEKCKVLEEKYDKVQEVAEEQTKERMEKIFIQLKGALDKVIKTFTKDTEVSSYYNIANMYM